MTCARCGHSASRHGQFGCHVWYGTAARWRCNCDGFTSVKPPAGPSAISSLAGQEPDKEDDGAD